MTTNHVLLEIAHLRLQFWQRQLQSAFREDNGEQAAVCERILAEYGLLVGECVKQLQRPFPGNAGDPLAQALPTGTECL